MTLMHANSTCSIVESQHTGPVDRMEKVGSKITKQRAGVGWRLRTFIPTTVNAFRRVQEVQLNDLVFILIASAHHHRPLLACSTCNVSTAQE